jgi:hypothetical protein
MSAHTRSLQGGHVRGRPLAMLAILLSVWVGARVIMWDSPISLAQDFQDMAGQMLAAQEVPPIADAADPVRQRAQSGLLASHARAAGAAGASSQPLYPQHSDRLAPLMWEEPVPFEPEDRASTAAGHQLIWMAAMSYLPVPEEVRHRAQVSSPVEPLRELNAKPDRWSMDGWALWREGSGNALVSQGRVPTYGASQAGAVLRYRIAPESRRDPTAYLRLYRALVDNGESEAAAGISARPLPQVPLRAHAELRVTEFAQGTEVRPAAFVTTELPVARLPLGLRAEAYGQAGYVAGDNATAFADGQMHVLRKVKRFDLGELSMGAAAWGGAQEGAERVDVGPSLRLDVKLGEVPARVSVDYRERVAGNAEPPSGVALTLSTRF